MISDYNIRPFIQEIEKCKRTHRQLLIGFQDTGKRTQLSCLGVPA